MLAALHVLVTAEGRLPHLCEEWEAHQACGLQAASLPALEGLMLPAWAWSCCCHHQQSCSDSEAYLQGTDLPLHQQLLLFPRQNWSCFRAP